jgi:hypothetical protein
MNLLTFMNTKIPRSSQRRLLAFSIGVIFLTLAAAQHANAQSNTVTGVGAGGSFTSGVFNTATGANSLRLDNTGFYNTGTGGNSLYSNTSGFQNTATGLNSMFQNTVGAFNTADGVSTLTNNTTGNANTAIGVQALNSANASYNTAVGVQAMAQNLSGSYNTAVGVSAMLAGTTPSFNTAVGLNALYYSDGSHNVGIGMEALVGNTSGSRNVGLGYQAGLGVTTGNDNIYIGSAAGSGGETGGIRIGTKGTHTRTFLTGVIQEGIETGTSEAPNPAGLVRRRINSTFSNPGEVVARTNELTLERDGTNGGFLIRNFVTTTSYTTIAIMGVTTAGASFTRYYPITTNQAPGTLQIITNADNVGHFECTFGITYSSGRHLTRVFLTRYPNDNYWSGDVVTTFDQ